MGHELFPEVTQSPVLLRETLEPFFSSVDTSSEWPRPQLPADGVTCKPARADHRRAVHRVTQSGGTA